MKPTRTTSLIAITVGLAAGVVAYAQPLRTHTATSVAPAAEASMGTDVTIHIVCLPPSGDNTPQDLGALDDAEVTGSHNAFQHSLSTRPFYQATAPLSARERSPVPILL